MAGNSWMTIFIGADNSEFLRRWESTRRAIRRGFGSEAMAASETAAQAIAGLGVALGALGVASIKMASDMQVNKTSFTTLLGSAEAAEKMLKDLASFAADTPFELPGLVVAAKKLMAFRFAAEDIIPIMSAVGDAIALVGGGQEAIDGVIRALGQMQAKGKLNAQDMNQLAERGINGWKYIAEEMGITVAEVMALSEKGAIDATTAINAVVKGMQTNFKGGMEALSKEIPGLLSTIKDNASAVAREIGDKIIEGLDLKNRLQSIADDLRNFAAIVESSGIKTAILTMVPPEAIAAVFALSGAIMAAAVPALMAFAINAWLAIAPLLPLIALGAALGVVAYEIWKNWEPLGALFNALMSGISATCNMYWGAIKTTFYTGVQAVLQVLSPLINLIGGELQQSATGWLDELPGKIADSTAQASQGVEKLAESVAAVKNAASGIQIGMIAKNVGDALAPPVSKPNRTFTGLHGAGGTTSSSDDEKAAKEAEKAWEKLQKKAEQVSKSIQDEWVQTTKTEIEQLDIWYAQQMSDLEETKAANENYQRDILRLEAVYSVRRRKILEDEEKHRNSIWDRALDAARSLQKKIGSIGLSGVVRDKFDIETDAKEQIDEIAKRYRDWEMDYRTATKQQQEDFRKAWEANGIQFEITATGMVDFSKQIAAEQVAIEREKNQKIKDLYYDRVKFQEDLDQAYKDGDIKRYKELLTKEDALLARDLDGKQSYIDEYYDIWKDAHRSTMSYMAEGMKTLYGGMKTLFSDIIDGTESIGDAFQALSKTVLKMINDWVSEWVSSRIMMGISSMFGGSSISSSSSGGLTSSQQAIANALLPTAFANGGVASGWSLVGEKGPELVNFSNPGRVYTASDTQKMLSGDASSGGNSYQVSVPVSISGVDIADKVAGRIRSEITELVQKILYEEARA